MLQAKGGGKNRFRVFEGEKYEDVQGPPAARGRVSRCAGAGRARGLPLFGLEETAPVAVEALFRWRRPEVGLIVATDFIPVLQNNSRWPNWRDIGRRPGELPSTSVMIRCFGGTRAIDVQLGAEAILEAVGEPTA